MPLPSKGRPALWLVVSLAFAVSLVFAGILFAASAQAQEASAPEATTEAPVGEATPESGAPPEQTTPPAGEQGPSTGEQVPPATEQTPPASEEADAPVQQPQPSGEHEQPPSATEEPVSSTEPTPPAAESPPPTTESTPPAAEDPPPTNEPTSPVTEQTPPTGEQAPSTAEEAPPAHEQETTEKQAGKSGEEASFGRADNRRDRGLADAHRFADAHRHFGVGPQRTGKRSPTRVLDPHAGSRRLHGNARHLDARWGKPGGGHTGIGDQLSTPTGPADKPRARRVRRIDDRNRLSRSLAGHAGNVVGLHDRLRHHRRIAGGGDRDSCARPRSGR